MGPPVCIPALCKKRRHVKTAVIENINTYGDKIPAFRIAEIVRIKDVLCHIGFYLYSQKYEGSHKSGLSGLHTYGFMSRSARYPGWRYVVAHVTSTAKCT